jgi:ribosomal protein S5
MFEKELKIMEMRQIEIQVKEGAQRERCRNTVSCVRVGERKGKIGIGKEKLEKEGGIDDRCACFASRNTVQEKQNLRSRKS